MAKNTTKANETYQAKQRKNANNLKALDYITAQDNQGKTITELANELNAQGYKTARGGTFRSNQVKRIFELFGIERQQ